MIITSVQNEKVKSLVKLMKQKKERDLQSRFVVEGEHLVFEAIKEGVAEEVLVLEGSQYDLSLEPIYVSVEVMNKICDTINPQGIIAICKQRKASITKWNRLLLLDDIKDPGNLGTIIRSADAFSFDGIYLSQETVDIYNPKVIRSTQGAIFRVNIIKCNLIEMIKQLKEQGVVIFASDLSSNELSHITKQEQMAIVMGNESKGVSQQVLDLANETITIEMTGQSESLNVSVAASIIMYQLRQ